MRVLLVGANGQLGRELSEVFEKRSKTITLVALGSKVLDVTDREAVQVCVSEVSPDIVVNASAMTKVDLCEDQVEHAFRVNALGVRNLVQAADRVRAKVVHFSTDYVFDGTTNRPYNEFDAPNPLSVYGRSKLAGERELRPTDLCVRTSWLVGRYGDNLVKTVLRMISLGQDLRFVNDQFGSLTVAQDLAEKVLEMIFTNLGGLYHVSGQGFGSWYDVVAKVLEIKGLGLATLKAISSSELPPSRKAPRPAFSALDDFALRWSGLDPMPQWDSSLARLVNEID
jgi:dTDP-4-dehydrorhamnose reductase